MRFLVTGGTGFIGSHMVEFLASRGHEVVCPVRDVTKLRHLKGLPARIVLIGELEREVGDNGGIDYVIHLAGATRAKDLAAYRSANVERTRDLLMIFSSGLCRDRIKKFVFVGSQAAAGPSLDGTTPIRESDVPRPVSDYGRSKLEAEQLVLQFQDVLPVSVIRPPTVFGPRDVDVLDVFRLAKYRIAPCLAGPDRYVSIVYVEDLVEGIYTACVSPRSCSNVYFICNAEPVIWRRFAVDVARICGYSAVSFPVPLLLMKIVAAAGDLRSKLTGSVPLLRSEKLDEMQETAWICSSEKAFSELGWQPRTSLDKAIGKTATWYAEHGWL
jgi:nucleoside-diphosphate-sugar epimerase